jgi:UDP-galactopyranose mutase
MRNNYHHKDLVCYSHLRWGFVYQRPQHLMSRFARERRVYFIEEPERAEIPEATLRTIVCENTGVKVITPLLPFETEARRTAAVIKELLAMMFAAERIHDYVAWFYTPMAIELMPLTRIAAVIYDCMDELSLFAGAPPELIAKEQELFRRADVVFTGGVSLFEAKRRHHRAVYAFPSSVDREHFMQARKMSDTAPDQKGLPHPRLGYAGVIDERIDVSLIAAIADARPNWQIIMIGPIAKISPADLPQRPNIHWLGLKRYSELPHYFAGWDVALMPFAINDATRYISPTKTPEYLAAGLPVVSTPVRDVVREYGRLGLARIASSNEEFIRKAEHALAAGMSMKWRERADEFLRTLSWERTWEQMNALVLEVADGEKRAGRAERLAIIATPMLSGGAA